MATRISIALIPEMTRDTLEPAGTPGKSDRDSEQVHPAPQAGHQPAALTPFEILRASIISYGDVVSPIEEDGWAPGP